MHEAEFQNLMKQEICANGPQNEGGDETIFCDVCCQKFAKQRIYMIE